MKRLAFSFQPKPRDLMKGLVFALSHMTLVEKIQPKPLDLMKKFELALSRLISVEKSRLTSVEIFQSPPRRPLEVKVEVAPLFPAWLGVQLSVPLHGATGRHSKFTITHFSRLVKLLRQVYYDSGRFSETVSTSYYRFDSITKGCHFLGL